MLEMMDESGGEITVNWHVNKDDELLVELCEDMIEDFENLKIQMIVE
jgi:hypothetical protein